MNIKILVQLIHLITPSGKILQQTQNAAEKEGRRWGSSSGSDEESPSDRDERANSAQSLATSTGKHLQEEAPSQQDRHRYPAVLTACPGYVQSPALGGGVGWGRRVEHAMETCVTVSMRPHIIHGNSIHLLSLSSCTRTVLFLKQ